MRYNKKDQTKNTFPGGQDIPSNSDNEFRRLTCIFEGSLRIGKKSSEVPGFEDGTYRAYFSIWSGPSARNITFDL